MVAEMLANPFENLNFGAKKSFRRPSIVSDFLLPSMAIVW
jgi:hypothetical protein